ncbi:MAG: PfkB family carbohydrate kinase [Mariprofundaceae bacterium]|nr:PfkB family carbohydrate kinase [Mariprofundaceae bacterium]
MIDVLCIGHASFDITMNAPHHPGSDEKMLANAMHLCGGGPAANAAVQVARLGGKAAFCGYLGNDIFGETHWRELQDEGVDTSAVVRGDTPTPVSQIIAKPDATRSVVNFKADTPWLLANAVDTSLLDKLAPRVVLFDGHEPLISEPICHRAKQHHIPTLLDAGSLHRGTQNLCKQVDYMLASETFARQRNPTSDVAAALADFANIAPHALITLGARGLLWAKNGETGELAAFAVDAIDSTGAGDAFHGAFALALARAMPWPDVLRFASAAGALACTQLGARIALADSIAVQQLLAATP